MNFKINLEVVSLGVIFDTMNANGTESIKVKRSIANKVRKAKKKSGTPIGKFFEIAALEKLDREALLLSFGDDRSWDKSKINSSK